MLELKFNLPPSRRVVTLSKSGAPVSLEWGVSDGFSNDNLDASLFPDVIRAMEEEGLYLRKRGEARGMITPFWGRAFNVQPHTDPGYGIQLAWFVFGSPFFHVGNKWVTPKVGDAYLFDSHQVHSLQPKVSRKTNRRLTWSCIVFSVSRKR